MLSAMSRIVCMWVSVYLSQLEFVDLCFEYSYFSYFEWYLLFDLESSIGLPWWLSGKESTCQCRRHGFDPWSEKIPHTLGQLSPWVTSTEPRSPRAGAPCNKRSHHNQKPVHCNLRVVPAHFNYRKPTHSSEDPTQPKINRQTGLK